MAAPAYTDISHFRVDKNAKIGRGSHGNVYRAVDLRTNQSVAAKEVYLGDDDEDIERTKREAVAMSKIPKHPNIIEYLGHEIVQEDLWIFMELCPLKDLDLFCEKSSIPPVEKVDIMIQIATGIRHFHHLDPPIAHRDIKPDNVLVTTKDGRIVVKLGDFSVAKIEDMSKRFSTIVGTRGFWAPELFELDDKRNDDTTYDISVDIFGAALVFQALMESDMCKLEPLQVDSKPVGLAMYLSKSRRGLTTPPIHFSINDSREMKMLKTLVGSMININPKDRPSIDDVLVELHAIASILRTAPGEQQEYEDAPQASYNTSCQIQSFLQHESAQKQDIVTYDHTLSECEDDDLEERPIVSIKSEQDLQVYDRAKFILGLDDATDLPEKVTDSEGTEITLIAEQKAKPSQGTISATVIQKGSIVIDNNSVKISSVATEELRKISDLTSQSKPRAEALALDFLGNFCSHYVTGKYEVGGMFEWIVICDDPSLKKLKGINRDLQKALKQTRSKLKGSHEGQWYTAEEVFTMSGNKKYSSDELSCFKIRISKYGGVDGPETYDDWSESVIDSNARLIPLSHEDEIQIVPVYMQKSIAEDVDMKSLLKDSMVRCSERDILSMSEQGPTGKSSNDAPPTKIRLGKADVIRKLGLTEYYPRKISLQQVMSVRSHSEQEEMQWENLPWMMLEKLVMMDCSARDGDISKCSHKRSSLNKQFSVDELFNTVMAKTEDDDLLHPLDVLLAVYQCCDPMLQQLVARKMFMCRLAIPFFIPDDDSGSGSVCALWPLEGIVIEWKDHKSISNEHLLTRHPMHMITFFRAGRPSLSKSKLMNQVMFSSGSNTFCNQDCPSGTNPCHTTEGMVDVSQYLPPGKENCILKDELLFANLHGNCCKCSKQAALINKMSSVVVLIVDIVEVNNVKETLEELMGQSLLLVLTSSSNACEQDMKDGLKVCQRLMGGQMKNVVIGITEGRTKTMMELKEEVLVKISQLLKETSFQCVSLEQHASRIAVAQQIQLDKDMIAECQEGQSMAAEVIKTLKNDSRVSKRLMLPLQGETWHEWSKLLKELFRAKEEGTKSLQNVKLEKEERMQDLRYKQTVMSKVLTPLAATFTEVVAIHHALSNTIKFFIHYLRLELDAISRKQLPVLQRQYQEAWGIHNSLKQDASQTEIIQTVKDQMESLQRDIADSTIGFEHLMRELGQIYESTDCASDTNTWSHLPAFAAQLLLCGIPFELMDGDAGNVPLVWIRAVLSSLLNMIGNKKVFIISVIGIQSSGKSTLLNTMFGLEFAVSAGRCTRGIFAQLMPAQAKSDLPFDYLMVLDTEGLRAPELGSQKYHHDNELASFVTGLADLTFMNIKGENTTEIEDVLQIVVQAFLRMKLAIGSKRQRCIFIHQNVSAVNADEKMIQGLNRLQDNLDALTKEAAEAEKTSQENCSFRNIIEFRGQDDVYYLPDLFTGCPPMASINIDYSRKVKELKTQIFRRITQEKPELLTVDDLYTRIQDMWRGILSDDFVFSFRNSIASKAHLKLEREFSELKFDLEQQMLEMERMQIAKIAKCELLTDLDRETHLSISNLKTEMRESLASTEKRLESFFDTSEYRHMLYDQKNLKLSCMRNVATLLEQKMEHELKLQRAQQYSALTYMAKKKDHEKKMLQTAMNLAQELRREKLTDEQIDNEFEHMWTTYVEPIPDEINTSIMRIKMEDQVLRQLNEENVPVDQTLPFLRGKIKSTDLHIGITADDVEDFHFKLKKGNMVKQAVNYIKGEKKLQLPTVVQLINDTLDGLGKFLDGILDDEKTFYQYSTGYVTTALRLFQAHVQFPLSFHSFHLTQSARYTFGAHAVYCAIVKFHEKFGKGEDLMAMTDIDSIKQVLQSVLLQEFDVVGQQKYIGMYLSYLQKEGVPMLNSLAGSVGERDIHNRLVSVSDRSDVTHFYSKAAKAMNVIMQIVDTGLTAICAEDSRFCNTHATKLVKLVLQAFEDFDAAKARAFTLTWECRAKFAVLVVRHALIKFEAMNIIHDLKHGGRSKVEQYKAQIKMYFIHQIKESELNETATQMLCHVLTREIYEVVIRKVADELTNKCLHNIGFAKHDLVIAILQHFVEWDNFQAYLQYICNAHEYATRWVRQYVLELSFKEKESQGGSLFAMLGHVHIDELIECLRNAVKVATAESKCDDMADRRGKWKHEFYTESCKKLYMLQEGDLDIISDLQVTDFEMFEELLLSRLSKVSDAMKEKFTNTDKDTVWWEGDAPEHRMMKTLWGCKEQCHFCGEPCKKTDADHTEPHQCVQHRPNGTLGVPWAESKQLSVLVCSTAVAGNDEYICKNDKCPKKEGEGSSEVKHLYKNYKECLPRWDIAPDNGGDASKYWKWFMGKYCSQLIDYYEMEGSDIPKRWKKIKRKDALESLEQYRK